MKPASLVRLACLVVSAASALHLPAAAVRPTHARAVSPMMKGKGTRGMPGKGATAPGVGAGMRKGSKQKMQKKDFERDEWTLVAAKDELGSEFGATMVIEAGQS